METLNNLYQWLSDEGVFLFDKPLPFSKKESNPQKSFTIKSYINTI